MGGVENISNWITNRNTPDSEKPTSQRGVISLQDGVGRTIFR